MSAVRGTARRLSRVNSNFTKTILALRKTYEAINYKTHWAILKTLWAIITVCCMIVCASSQLSGSHGEWTCTDDLHGRGRGRGFASDIDRANAAFAANRGHRADGPQRRGRHAYGPPHPQEPHPNDPDADAVLGAPGFRDYVPLPAYMPMTGGYQHDQRGRVRFDTDAIERFNLHTRLAEVRSMEFSLSQLDRDTLANDVEVEDIAKRNELLDARHSRFVNNERNSHRHYGNISNIVDDEFERDEYLMRAERLSAHVRMSTSAHESENLEDELNRRLAEKRGELDRLFIENEALRVSLQTAVAKRDQQLIETNHTEPNYVSAREEAATRVASTRESTVTSVLSRPHVVADLGHRARKTAAEAHKIELENAAFAALAPLRAVTDEEALHLAQQRLAKLLADANIPLHRLDPSYFPGEVRLTPEGWPICDRDYFIRYEEPQVSLARIALLLGSATAAVACPPLLFHYGLITAYTTLMADIGVTTSITGICVAGYIGDRETISPMALPSVAIMTRLHDVTAYRDVYSGHRVLRDIIRILRSTQLCDPNNDDNLVPLWIKANGFTKVREIPIYADLFCVLMQSYCSGIITRNTYNSVLNFALSLGDVKTRPLHMVQNTSLVASQALDMFYYIRRIGFPTDVEMSRYYFT